MDGYFLHMCICVACVCIYTWQPERGIELYGTGVTDSCKPAYACWKLLPRPEKNSQFFNHWGISFNPLASNALLQIWYSLLLKFFSMKMFILSTDDLNKQHKSNNAVSEKVAKTLYLYRFSETLAHYGNKWLIMSFRSLHWKRKIQ